MAVDNRRGMRSAPELTESDQKTLVESIRDQGLFGAEASTVTVRETHISYVLLAGAWALKIKKAVDLEFLDFTTLAARLHYCREELRLNRVLAPSMYLDVLAIGGTPSAPVVGTTGAVIEYAVKMRRFDDDALLSDKLAQGKLTEAQIDQLAATVSEFHERAGRATADMPFGRPEDILQPAVQNFDQLMPIARDPDDRRKLADLRAWTLSAHQASTPLFERRRRDGFVRECHGDLHLGNIALVDGRVTLFDRIEFNESMRWIDVLNDVAFVVMDLQERTRPELAARFLNDYLEATGDYDGLPVLPFYIVYRSMVRAKVDWLRFEQMKASPRAEAVRQTYRAYLECARRHSSRTPAAIVITHGLAGSGKTTCARELVERAGAVRIRTDVERKRLHGLRAGESSQSSIGGGLYGSDVSRETYHRVRALARTAASAGFIVVVDGTFQERRERDALHATADALGVPFVILDVQAPESVLRARIRERAAAKSDASEATIAVLDSQLANHEPLASEERPHVVTWNTNLPDSQSGGVVRQVLDRIGERAFSQSCG
jgi:aminoglycoside phosphotransferase family enzyme/predicted kinase